MNKISFTLMAIMFAFVPEVFAQDVNQTTSAPAETIATTSTPVTMAFPDNTDPFQVSVQGGGLWAQKDDGRLHDGSEIIGRLTYDVTPYVALGGESGGLRFDDEAGGNKYGHLDGVPAMADLVLKMPISATQNHLVPYVYGAAGVIFWSYAKSGYSDTTGVDAASRTHFAAKPGAGIEYYLTPHVALFIEGSYLYSERFNLRNATTSPPNGDVNVDSIYGGGGIKIAF